MKATGRTQAEARHREKNTGVDARTRTLMKRHPQKRSICCSLKGRRGPHHHADERHELKMSIRRAAKVVIALYETNSSLFKFACILHIPNLRSA